MEDDENEIQQQIEQRIGELPEDMQQAILSSDFGDKVLAIGSAAKLHIDQIQDLNNISMLGMLGFMPLENLEREIVSQVGVSPDIAAKLAAGVNTQIFLPIRESMKKFAAGEAAPTARSVPIQSAPQPEAPRAPLSQVLPKTPTYAPTAPAQMPAAPIVSDIPGMKSSSAAPAPTATAAVPMMAPPILPIIASVPKIEMHPADTALTEKTVSVAPSTSAAPAPVTSATTSSGVASPASPKATQGTAPKPADYKADPYREPIS